MLSLDWLTYYLVRYLNIAIYVGYPKEKTITEFCLFSFGQCTHDYIINIPAWWSGYGMHKCDIVFECLIGLKKWMCTHQHQWKISLGNSQKRSTTKTVFFVWFYSGGQKSLTPILRTLVQVTNEKHLTAFWFLKKSSNSKRSKTSYTRKIG